MECLELCEKLEVTATRPQLYGMLKKLCEKLEVAAIRPHFYGMLTKGVLETRCNNHPTTIL